MVFYLTSRPPLPPQGWYEFNVKTFFVFLDYKTEKNTYFKKQYLLKAFLLPNSSNQISKFTLPCRGPNGVLLYSPSSCCSHSRFRQTELCLETEFCLDLTTLGPKISVRSELPSRPTSWRFSWLPKAYPLIFIGKPPLNPFFSWSSVWSGGSELLRMYIVWTLLSRYSKIDCPARPGTTQNESKV